MVWGDVDIARTTAGRIQCSHTWLVFDRIGNDMESLCDQRVLERLEGEERRKYGKNLLDMANARYARTPGTTSISNGEKQISRQIQAIIRFKITQMSRRKNAVPSMLEECTIRDCIFKAKCL